MALISHKSFKRLEEIVYRRVPVAEGSPQTHTVAVLACSRCNAEGQVGLGTRLPPPVILGKFRQKGWAVSERGTDRACPACAQKKEKSQPRENIMQTPVLPSFAAPTPTPVAATPATVLPDTDPAPILQPENKMTKPVTVFLMDDPLPVTVQTILRQQDGADILFTRDDALPAMTMNDAVKLRQSGVLINIDGRAWAITDVALTVEQTIVLVLALRTWLRLGQPVSTDLAPDGWRAVAREEPPAPWTIKIAPRAAENKVAMDPDDEGADVEFQVEGPAKTYDPWVIRDAKKGVRFVKKAREQFNVADFADEMYPDYKKTSAHSKAGVVLRFLESKGVVRSTREGMRLIYEAA